MLYNAVMVKVKEQISTFASGLKEKLSQILLELGQRLDDAKKSNSPCLFPQTHIDAYSEVHKYARVWSFAKPSREIYPVESYDLRELLDVLDNNTKSVEFFTEITSSAKLAGQTIAEHRLAEIEQSPIIRITQSVEGNYLPKDLRLPEGFDLSQLNLPRNSHVPKRGEIIIGEEGSFADDAKLKAAQDILNRWIRKRNAALKETAFSGPDLIEDSKAKPPFYTDNPFEVHPSMHGGLDQWNHMPVSSTTKAINNIRENDAGKVD